MYTIKKYPEDFYVKEIINLELDNNGNNSYFLLKKKDYNTIDAIRKISKIFKVREKDIGFAGNKDKRAVTEQYISIPKRTNKEIKLRDIELEFVGYGKERLNLGDNKGNFFRIVIREAKTEPKAREEFTNYFGEQRFGRNNVEIGRLIVKKKFDEASELLGPPKGLKGIQQIPKRILKMYLSGYQSYLWNTVVSRMDKLPDKVSLVGFDTELKEEEYVKLMTEEGITPRDFIIRQLPLMSVEGGERKTRQKASNLKIQQSDKGFEIEFELPKGSYATVFINQLFSR